MSKRKIAKTLKIASLCLALSALPAQAENMIPAVGDAPAPYANVPRSAESPQPTERVETTTTETYGQPSEHSLQEAQVPSAPVWQSHPSDGKNPNANAAETVSMSAGATGMTSLPQPIEAGTVRYITGGVGDEERDALEASKKDYDLHITSVNTSGEFLEDTQVTIVNQKGEEVLKTTAGPLLYVELPAGSYTVEALSGGETKKQKVTVGPHKSSSVTLRW